MKDYFKGTSCFIFFFYKCFTLRMHISCLGRELTKMPILFVFGALLFLLIWKSQNLTLQQWNPSPSENHKPTLWEILRKDKDKHTWNQSYRKLHNTLFSFLSIVAIESRIKVSFHCHEKNLSLIIILGQPNPLF